MYHPRIGWLWIKPLQYGDVIECYQNRQRDAPMLAYLFRQAIVGFEDITPYTVRMMPTWLPTELEAAVIKASDLLDFEEEEDDPEPEEVPENSIWAKHNRSTHGTARDTADNLTESDLIYALHHHGEDQQQIYKMLIGEMTTLLEGAEREQERQQKRMKENQPSSGPSRTKTARNAGSRQDRASQVFGR